MSMYSVSSEKSAAKDKTMFLRFAFTKLISPSELLEVLWCFILL